MTGRILILGSGSAVPEEDHGNTYLVITQGKRHILVDCPANPLGPLSAAGLAWDDISDLVLTHFHPDHVAGAPQLLMDMWLLGRTAPLHIYGLAHTIDRLEIMMGLYDWKKWPHFFPVLFHRLPEFDQSVVIHSPDLKILSSPVKHLLPTIGLRIEFVPQEKVVAYSCDTEPCPQVVALAAGADVLIHEATGSSVGHSSAVEAAQVARQAGALQLLLIHYPIMRANLVKIQAEAQAIFDGPVDWAVDGMRLEF